MWPKYLPLATFAYTTFNTPNLGNFSPYELVFGRKPKLLLNLETTPDIKFQVLSMLIMNYWIKEFNICTNYFKILNLKGKL